MPAFVCEGNSGVFLQDAFWLVSKHHSITSLLLSQAVNNTEQLVTRDLHADHLVQSEKLKMKFKRD